MAVIAPCFAVEGKIRLDPFVQVDCHLICLSAYSCTSLERATHLPVYVGMHLLTEHFPIQLVATSAELCLFISSFTPDSPSLCIHSDAVKARIWSSKKWLANPSNASSTSRVEPAPKGRGESVAYDQESARNRNAARCPRSY